MARRNLSIRVILLSATGALALLIVLLVTREIYAEWQKLADIHKLKQATLLSDQLFDTAEALEVERDIGFSILYTGDKDIAGDLALRLKSSRQDVDGSFESGMQQLETYDFEDLAEPLRQIERKYARLKELRRQIDSAIPLPAAQRDRELSQLWFTEATALIMQTQDLWMAFARHYANIDSYVALNTRFKHILGTIMEYSGRQRSLIGRLLAENVDPTPQEQADLLRWAGVVNIGWEIGLTLADQGHLTPVITPCFEDAKSHYFTIYDMVRDIFYVPGAHTRPYPINVEFWLDLATQANDSLYALKNAALKQSRAYVEALDDAARRAILYHAMLLACALGICLYTLWIVTCRVIRPINAMADALVAAAEGKTVTPVAIDEKRRDEIGKLAVALRASQQNMEEIRRHSAEVATYAQALERSNHELDDFAYIASHDLKEPLRGLHNHAQFLLEDNKEKLDEESGRRLERLIYLSERMERLVNDLLYYSRIGRQELAVQKTDINAVIDDIRSTLDMFLADRSARIEAPRILPTISCDKTRITEVFRNLITNAVKYNDNAEKTVEIGFLKSATAPDGSQHENVFSVKDNGRGIAPEFHQDIFRMFKRLQEGTGGKEEGTGVGLTFVKKIVERHGGKIWLESDIGKGTTFYFTMKEEAGAKKAA